MSRVAPDSPYGAASLNLTNIRESDQVTMFIITITLKHAKKIFTVVLIYLYEYLSIFFITAAIKIQQYFFFNLYLHL